MRRKNGPSSFMIGVMAGWGISVMMRELGIFPPFQYDDNIKVTVNRIYIKAPKKAKKRKK